ncbi:MAG: CAF17-like 4Fe-4S cluster assembly/insertion protein YgfZ [Gemmatimonadaceae bacterium]
MSADTMSAYDALRGGAIVLDRSGRGRWRFTGPKAAETLTGLVTNDVLALQPGDGLYAAALTAKGRIVADLRILRDGDDYLVDTGPAAAAGWRAMTRKFVNPRVAPFSEITEQTRDVGVFGNRSAELLSRLFEGEGCAFDQLRPYAHIRPRFEPAGDAIVVRAAELGEIPGFDVVASAATAEAISDRLIQLGAVRGSREAFDIARIEAGFPEWGADMSEDTLAQEANLDQLGAISYSKGCYVGQEVVARIYFRGHVNRMLRRVTFEGERVPPRGAELVDAEGKIVGDMRSSAVSPRAGGVGLAMVRREIGAGAALSARWDESSANVVAL